jgi:hypothetical protein
MSYRLTTLRAAWPENRPAARAAAASRPRRSMFGGTEGAGRPGRRVGAHMPRRVRRHGEAGRTDPSRLALTWDSTETRAGMLRKAETCPERLPGRASEAPVRLAGAPTSPSGGGGARRGLVQPPFHPKQR